MGRVADVHVGAHFEDNASKAAQKMFQKIQGDLKGLERQGKQTQTTLGGLGGVLKGLITLEMIRKVAGFTVEITKMSSQGQRSVDQMSRSWQGFEKTLGTVLSKPLSGFFQEGSRALDGFAVQIEAFGVLYHKIFGGMADTPTIDRLSGIKTKAIGPKAELAKMIKQAQLDERLNAIGEQVDTQIAQEKEKKQSDAKERARKAAEFSAKKQKEFEEMSHRLGPGNIGKVMAQAGGPPSLLGSLMNPQDARQRGVERLSGGKANAVGTRLAVQFGIGFKQGLQTNKTDFRDPSVLLADEVAYDFRSRMVGVLSQSYEDLLSGDFEDALKGLGGGMVNSLATSFTDKLADATINSKLGQSLSDFIGKGTSKAVEGIGGIVSTGLDKGLDMETLRRLGSRAGGHLKGGVESGFNWLMPDVSTSWGPQGATFNAIKGGMENALRGGIIGAGVGGLIGADIRISGIGGILGEAIGSAFGQASAGAAAGGLIAGLMDKAFGDDYDKTQNKNYRDILTDISSFGGMKGFVQRIGGFSGLRGDRAEVFFDADHQDELADIIRTSMGATKEQAEGVLRVMRGQAAKNIDPSVSGAAVGVSAELQPQVLNVLRSMGFTEEQIEGVTFAGATRPRGKTVDPPPAIAPVVPTYGTPTAASPSLQSQAAALLTRMFQNNTVSRSALGTIGMDAISAAATQMGGVWPQFVGPLRGILAGSPHEEQWMNSRGVDVVAARGYSQEINRPTVISVGGGPRILAGEAGRETLAVIPHGLQGKVSSAGYGAGGANINLHLHVGNPIGDSTHAWVTREVYPIIKQLLWQDSNNGTPLIRSKAVVA